VGGRTRMRVEAVGCERVGGMGTRLGGQYRLWFK